jgi:hypothetical protein
MRPNGDNPGILFVKLIEKYGLQTYFEFNHGNSLCSTITSHTWLFSNFSVYSDFITLKQKHLRHYLIVIG